MWAFHLHYGAENAFQFFVFWLPKNLDFILLYFIFLFLKGSSFTSAGDQFLKLNSYLVLNLSTFLNSLNTKCTIVMSRYKDWIEIYYEIAKVQRKRLQVPQKTQRTIDENHFNRIQESLTL